MNVSLLHNKVFPATVLILILASGCASTKPETEEAWTPKPLVNWNQLDLPAHSSPTEGYKILVPQPTQGLFPASMSVGRVAVLDDDEQTGKAKTELVRDPRNEFLQWNTAFDDQMAVSEVFPVAQRDLGGGKTEPDLVLAAMNALGGRIGLIYAVNEISPEQAEMIGAIYETADGRPLASVHAMATGTFSEDEEDQDVFETHAMALVRAKFENFVYDCLRDLIVNDDPAEVEMSDGWIPDRPLRPAEWPPRW